MQDVRNAELSVCVCVFVCQHIAPHQGGKVIKTNHHESSQVMMRDKETSGEAHFLKARATAANYLNYNYIIVLTNQLFS